MKWTEVVQSPFGMATCHHGYGIHFYSSREEGVTPVKIDPLTNTEFTLNFDQLDTSTEQTTDFEVPDTNDVLRTIEYNQSGDFNNIGQYYIYYEIFLYV